LNLPTQNSEEPFFYVYLRIDEQLQEMHMKVTVKLFAFFREGRFKVEEREYPEATTVSQVIEGLGIDPNEVGITMINSRHCQLETLVKEGDNIAIFPVIGGG
jgi:sulfur-carrier protein